MLNIGIDIDDTLTKTSELANEILHQNEEFKNILDYHNLDKNTLDFFIRKNIEKIQNDVELNESAKEVIDYLKDNGCKIVFITARGSLGLENLIPITKKYLSNKEIYYDKIIFKQESKVDECIKNNIDIFIDDKEKVLDEIKKANIKTLRFCSSKTISKHEKVSNWLEVKDYIDKILKEK